MTDIRDRLIETNIDGLNIIQLINNINGKKSLTEVHNPDWLGTQIKHSYVCGVERGFANGMHAHLVQQDQWTLLYGVAHFLFYDARKNKSTFRNWLEVVAPEKSIFLTIPPGVLHGFEALSKKIEILNTPSASYNASQPDEYRVPFNDSSIPPVFRSQTGDIRNEYCGSSENKKELERLIDLSTPYLDIGRRIIFKDGKYTVKERRLIKH